MEPTQGAMLLTSPVRRLAVDVLTERGALTAAELATALDLHVTTMRFHLDQLNGAGIVTSEFIKQPGAGRPKKVYSVAPGSFDTHRDQEALGTLTALLAETLTLAHDEGVTIRPDEAGRRWARRNVAQDSTTPASSAGAWLAKIGHMIDVLQEWGYTPNVRTQDGGRTAVIDLVHCPFLELATATPLLSAAFTAASLPARWNNSGSTRPPSVSSPFCSLTYAEPMSRPEPPLAHASNPRKTNDLHRIQPQQPPHGGTDRH